MKSYKDEIENHGTDWYRHMTINPEIIEVVMDGMEFGREPEEIQLEAAKRAHYPLIMADTMSRGTGGKVYHAHDHDARQGVGRALCGAKPGKRGYWSAYWGVEVTCPKCLKIINSQSADSAEE